MLQIFWKEWEPIQQGQADERYRWAWTLACLPLPPYQPQWPSLKVVTAGSKARRFQQLVNAVGQAAFKGQVSLHNSGLILTHHELTLQAEGVGYMGLPDAQQPSPQCQGPCLFPSGHLPRLTGRARLHEKEMGVPCKVRSGPRLGRSDAKA